MTVIGEVYFDVAIILTKWSRHQKNKTLTYDIVSKGIKKPLVFLSWSMYMKNSVNFICDEINKLSIYL